MGQMSEFRPGDKVAVHGEIAEISGTTAIIRSGGGLVAADLGQLEHSVTAGGVQSPAGIPGAVTAVYDEGSAAVTETQLSFTVTKHWARPEGEAGWTEMTCSKGSFRRVLEWMLEEFPDGTVRIGHNTMVFQDGTEQICINWPAVPDGIRTPVIPPYLPPVDEGAATIGHILKVMAGWACTHEGRHQPDEDCDFNDAREQILAAIRGEVPERPEP